MIEGDDVTAGGECCTVGGVGVVADRDVGTTLAAEVSGPSASSRTRTPRLTDAAGIIRASCPPHCRP